MQKYVASSPNSLILGLALRAILESVEVSEFADLVAANGLDKVKDDEWYPTQQILTMYKEISQRINGTDYLVSIGVKVFENAILPEGVNSILATLHLLNTITELNMRNVPTERFEIESLGDQHIRVTDTTAFPHDLIYGYLFGICRRFTPKGSTFSLRRTFVNPTDPDMDSAVYEISW